jgi:hypothetical protein
MDKATTKRIGRPTKPPKPGERVTLGLRVTPEVKEKLQLAAVGKGRSLSQEAEFRLERSFETESLLPDVLTLAYGQRLAAVLAKIGQRMHAFEAVPRYITSAEEHIHSAANTLHDPRLSTALDHLKLFQKEEMPLINSSLMVEVLDNLRDYFGKEFERAIEQVTETEGDDRPEVTSLTLPSTGPIR